MSNTGPGLGGLCGDSQSVDRLLMCEISSFRLVPFLLG